MTPSHMKETPVRPIMKIIKDVIGKYGWWATRWAIDWKGREEDYIFAYMAFPRGYVLHETATVENEESGAKAQLVLFRREDVPDVRIKELETKPAMAAGGYL